MILKIKVIPNAKKDRQGEELNGYRKVYITAPPVDNKANEHLIKFLSELHQVPKSRIRILQGHNSHYKTIELLSGNK